MTSAQKNTQSVKFSLKPIASLTLNPNNARTHSKKQLAKIAASIKRFGFTAPIVADGDGVILAGHGRYDAALKLGMTEVPCVSAAHLNDEEKRAYMLADNRIANDSGWDDVILRNELKELSENDFDLSVTGFDDAEIDGFLAVEVEATDADDIVPTIKKINRSKLGDVWLLGEHRLMCGDSTDHETVRALMGENSAGMVFTDPPYGISVVSKDGSLGGNTKGKYKPVIGDEDTDAAAKAYAICQAMGFKFQFFWGANHYSNIFPSSSCWVVWDKQGGKSVTFADCELCYTNLDKPVRMFTHIWDGFRRSSEKGEQRVHPTQKPVQLIVDIFKKFSCPDTCLDLFGGSGSTLIACEKTERKCFMMELDPHYIDVIITRWQNFTGDEAIRKEDGETFNAVSERAVKNDEKNAA